MAQYDVFANPSNTRASGKPQVVLIQSDPVRSLGVCLIIASLCKRGERPKPGIEVGDVECSSREHLDHLGVNLHRSTMQAPAIDAQEHVGRCKGGEDFACEQAYTGPTYSAHAP